MKKKMAMTVMALAVSAMAGSAFAANEPAKTTGSSAPLKMVTKDGTDALNKPIFNLEQMAKEKGISVEELIKQLEKEGKLTKGAATITKDGDLTTSFSFIPFDANSDNSKPIDLDEMAKEKGISVEELIEQLKKEGKVMTGVATSSPDGTNPGLTVISLDPENKDGGAFIALDPAMNLEEMAKEKGISVEELIEQLKEDGKLAMYASTAVINLEEVAKEKGISVEELIKQLEKEGTIATGEAASFTHPAISLEQMAKEKGISVEELIKQLEKEGKITRGETVAPASLK
ncbi:hypothetical protein [Brevibacillus sp. DP1.3A]|uniref:hypothetical protein n=1 Tax=Brevibacillus sp. DP1.3A TaxID=2738867 RepID=UPI00156B4EBA|nr:hypothetical protein [Brevibacillus sp. DP1.3A]UED75342.1 hypothetical protein HP399_002280 [Brevibacillus sp. DP1.3A]